MENKIQLATFGAGCFWGVEEAFRALPGVQETAVGYMGGSIENPSYEDVCSDETGHAEVVQVQYNPDEVSYDALLEKFWEVHDPTQVNRQGPDVGTQYRSVIFYHTDEQKALAEKSKNDIQHSSKYGSQTIATVIEPASTFNRAEEYHQKYLMKQGAKICH